MHARHMFPGGNTSSGFFNRFNGIFPDWEDNNRLYILKGGPGVGKNTFMKRIGKKAQAKELDVEYFHCASDADSLDAVRIPSLGVTLLDGTAPHIVDPKYPGAVDQIWNLGRFLDEEKLGKRKDKIIALCAENSFQYKITFSYLKAAGSLEMAAHTIYDKALNYSRLQDQVKNLFCISQNGRRQGISHFRTLFYSAYTPTGLVDYSPVLPSYRQVIFLDGPKEVASRFIKLAFQYADDYGYSGELFFSPLLPDEPVHLVIRELDLYLTTTRPESEHFEVITLSDFEDITILETYSHELSSIPTQIHTLTAEALRSLSVSKKIHDDLEREYSDCINFDQVNEFCEIKISKLFQ